MANTFFGLNIGKSGVYTAMSGINTTAHNISNTETEGYSRQVVNQKASKALKVNSTYGMMGSGVDLVSIDQIRDSYYDEKFRTNSAIYGEYNSKHYYMTEVENYFNEIQLKGFTTTFNELYDSIQEVAKNPSALTNRTAMTNKAQATCDYFNYMYERLQSIQEEINLAVESQINQINGLAVQIAEITREINTSEVLGGVANDLRDQREVLIDELSQMVAVTTEEKIVGESEVGVSSYTVRINGQLLVDTYRYNELAYVPREEKINQCDIEGIYDIVWAQTGQTFKCSPNTDTGSIAALYAMMDGNDNMAFKGMAEANVGDREVKLVSDFEYMNQVETMTLSREGIITVGNREYSYNGFKVEQRDDGRFEYTFSLNDPILVDTDNIASSKDPITGFKYNTTIGNDVNYKGVPYYMNKLNEYIRTFAKAFNDIHKEGVDLNDDPGMDFFNGTDPVTGKNFVLTDNWPYGNDSGNVLFDSKSGIYAQKNETATFGSYYFITAGNYCVTNDIMQDANKVVTAENVVDGVENADIVNRLSELCVDDSMFKQGNPSSFLNTMIAEIGIDKGAAMNFAQNQEDIISTIENQRLSISGVDTDDEIMNLVRYQTAYEMSAKIISVMDEIYRKLVNEFGM